MLTELVIQGYENFPIITEKISDKIAWYIGDFFKRDDVIVNTGTTTRLIVLPPDTRLLTENGKLTIGIGAKILRVIL